MKDRAEYYKYIESLPENYCFFCDWENTQEIIEIRDNWIWHLSMSPVWRYHTMLTPKRHVVLLNELNGGELKEMVSFHQDVIENYKRINLIDKDGNPYKKYEMLWRVRNDTYDTVTGNMKPDHFHLNIYPFRDHHTDPVMDKDAFLYDFRREL